MPDLQLKFERLKRIKQECKQNKGKGFKQKYEHDDGSKTEHVVKNIKSPEQYEDQIANLAVNLWSLKDYLVAELKVIGKDPQVVEKYVNSCPSLQLCADIANTEKHKKLHNSRSEKWPVLGRARVVVPGHSVNELIFQGPKVTTSVRTPESAEYKIDILDKEGRIVGDAEQTLDRALDSWERFFNQNFPGRLNIQPANASVLLEDEGLELGGVPVVPKTPRLLNKIPNISALTFLLALIGGGGILGWFQLYSNLPNVPELGLIMDVHYKSVALKNFDTQRSVGRIKVLCTQFDLSGGPPIKQIYFRSGVDMVNPGESVRLPLDVFDKAPLKNDAQFSIFVWSYEFHNSTMLKEQRFLRDPTTPNWVSAVKELVDPKQWRILDSESTLLKRKL